MRSRFASKTPVPRRVPLALAALALLALGLVVWAVVSADDAGPDATETAPIGRLAPLEAPPPTLDLGTYEVSRGAVIDGDTLRLPDGRRIRVLGLDTEEVFRSPQDRREAAADFEAYARRRRGDAQFPRKFATPAGEAAREAARVLVDDAGSVRIEGDHEDAPAKDQYGRLLAHVVLCLEEGDALLAEVLIEAGHSPYFVKYGRCRRFDARLRRAEAEARRAGRGIWSADGPHHYPDYPERLDWWHARADQVERWRSAAPTPDRVDLESSQAADRLRGLVGSEATVFGLVRATRTKGRPRILWMRHLPKRDFAVVFFSDEVWEAIDHAATGSRFVAVTGPVSLYRDRPQIVVTDPSQVRTD